MRITDTHSIEELAAAQLVATENALIALDAKDYERMKAKLGPPSFAVDIGDSDSVDSLCKAIRDELPEADLEQTMGILLLVQTSRKRGRVLLERPLERPPGRKMRNYSHSLEITIPFRSNT